MVYYVFIMGIGTIHVGWGILGNAQTALILIAKFGWDKEETKLYNSLLSNAGLIGIMLGALFGGPVITKGRRLACFTMSIVLIIGVGLTQIQTLPTMILGRFINGAAGSVL